MTYGGRLVPRGEVSQSTGDPVPILALTASQPPSAWRATVKPSTAVRLPAVSRRGDLPRQSAYRTHDGDIAAHIKDSYPIFRCRGVREHVPKPVGMVVPYLGSGMH